MKPTVILRRAPAYDPEHIQRLVVEGLHTLDLVPHGKVLVKPNIVAAGELFPHAHTRPEFTEGVLRGLREVGGSQITELGVGEKCGITIQQRFAFKMSGHYEVFDRVGGVVAHHFDEVSQVPIPLYHRGRLRDVLFTPKPVAEADFFVNCPKFKAHPWTTVTFSMKNHIGIQDDRHRLLDHDHKLNAKVTDLQYITQAQFICTDAIIAGEGRMLTPIPFDMGLVAMGNNQVAFDTVCCHIIGIDPRSVDHIRMAHEQGFGPIRLDEIDIVGDASLDEMKARASTFRSGLIRVEEYFKGSSIRAYAGPPPSQTDDYCWGGCPGALEEAIEILRLYDRGTDDRLPPIHIVFGRYQGQIPAQEGERVIFMGDCASFEGDIAGTPVHMPSIYEDRESWNPLDLTDESIYTKMLRLSVRMWKDRKDQVLRLSGCPVSVAEQAMLLVHLGKLKNPYFDPNQAVPFVSTYFSRSTRIAMKRLMGIPYNEERPSHRGAARPSQNLPPGGMPTPWEA
jgi:uncharacterized protein (DUF362 family)